MTSFRRTALTSLLTDPEMRCFPVWIVNTMQKTDKVILGRAPEEPCVAIGQGKAVHASFNDQTVIMDLDTMRFEAKDRAGKKLVLEFNAHRPQPLPELFPPATLA